LAGRRCCVAIFDGEGVLTDARLFKMFLNQGVLGEDLRTGFDQH
jgi:hypothetical protein